jgi:hypothetical protein
MLLVRMKDVEILETVRHDAMLNPDRLESGRRVFVRFLRRRMPLSPGGRGACVRRFHVRMLLARMKDGEILETVRHDAMLNLDRLESGRRVSVRFLGDDPQRRNRRQSTEFNCAANALLMSRRPRRRSARPTGR